jgi:type IV pilus assembly protein PilO
MAGPAPAQVKPAPVGAGAQFVALPAPAKLGIGVALVAALCAIYYFALHSPLADQISAARRRGTELEEERESALARQAEYLALREELTAREGLDRANLRVLPEDAEMAAFLADLTRLAELSGLQMRLVEPQPEEEDEHYTRLPVSLHLAGRYHQLTRFFYNVSRLERAISMENLVMDEPTEEGEDVVITVEVLATTYRRPRAEEPPGAAPATGGHT